MLLKSTREASPGKPMNRRDECLKIDRRARRPNQATTKRHAPSPFEWIDILRAILARGVAPAGMQVKPLAIET